MLQTKNRQETITNENTIDPKTGLGYVELTVPDLARSLPFYREVLGFKLHKREGGIARLGAGGDDLLVLKENPEAKRPAFATGLYHFAILVPSRLELARSLKQMADMGTAFQGFADHAVSEAIYLADPDGNGIEIYRDRPRQEWYDTLGRLRMTTEPLDVDGILRELERDEHKWSGLNKDTVLGHMHLQVSSVKPAEAFYRSVLGMGLMMNWGTASFVSAGGYHHHIGMNIWNSAGAPPPPPDSSGLLYFTIKLPNAGALARVADRVHTAGQPLTETDEGLAVSDPSGNGIVLTVDEEVR